MTTKPKLLPRPLPDDYGVALVHVGGQGGLGLMVVGGRVRAPLIADAPFDAFDPGTLYHKRYQPMSAEQYERAARHILNVCGLQHLFDSGSKRRRGTASIHVSPNTLYPAGFVMKALRDD